MTRVAIILALLLTACSGEQVEDPAGTSAGGDVAGYAGAPAVQSATDAKLISDPTRAASGYDHVLASRNRMPRGEQWRCWLNCIGNRRHGRQGCCRNFWNRGLGRHRGRTRIGAPVSLSEPGRAGSEL